MRQVMAAAMLAATLAIAPAHAREAEAQERSPGALAAEGLEKLLRAFDLFIDSIPQYEPPVITDDGDIIIRRKRKPDAQPAPEPVPRTGDGIKI